MDIMMMVLASVLIIIGLNLSKEKEIMKITWPKVAEFCGFLAILFVARVCLFDWALKTGAINALPMPPPEIELWRLLLVFWEDVFFGIPIYFAAKYLKNKWVFGTFVVTLSLLFGSGHAYQGLFAVGITALLPYFVCYKYGKRYGFGTTMISHILYDFSTIAALKLAPYLIYNIF
jgi:hypothetical protein